MKSAILVTGGAGYIGSHVVRQLGEAGRQVVVVDNLSKGFREAVLYGDLVVGDTGDLGLISRLLEQYTVESVMHFAARGCGDITMPLRDFMEINILNIAVDVGFVVGMIAATTPMGSATSRIFLL